MGGEGGLELPISFSCFRNERLQIPSRGWWANPGRAPKTPSKGFRRNPGLGSGVLAAEPLSQRLAAAQRGGASVGAQAPSGARRGPRDSFQFRAAVCSEQEAAHARERAGRACAPTPDWPRVAELVEQVALPPRASVSPSGTWVQWQNLPSKAFQGGVDAWTREACKSCVSPLCQQS